MSTAEIRTNEWKIYLFSTLLTGLGMWITGGLYHNLILPAINDAIHPHHKGLGITLIAYFILALLMTYIYSISNPKVDTVLKGVKLGVIIGILWVLPHGLAMAATHDTSMVYEFKNTLYHSIEQGIGGLIIFYVFNYLKRKKEINLKTK
jgi:uncharacterized membrane-anchored protein